MPTYDRHKSCRISIDCSMENSKATHDECNLFIFARIYTQGVYRGVEINGSFCRWAALFLRAEKIQMRWTREKKVPDKTDDITTRTAVYVYALESHSTSYYRFCNGRRKNNLFDAGSNEAA